MRRRFFLAAYGVGSLGLVLYGGVVFVSPDVLLGPFLSSLSPLLLDAEAEAYLAGLGRLLGFFNLLVGLVGLVLLLRFRQLAQAWVLLALTGSVLASYLAPIIFDNTVGSVGPFEVVELVLFGAMLLAAAWMLLPWPRRAG